MPAVARVDGRIIGELVLIVNRCASCCDKINPGDVPDSWRRKMEDWKMAVFWLALGINLAVGAWNLAVAVRREWSAERLEHETYKDRPLLSADKVAV